MSHQHLWSILLEEKFCKFSVNVYQVKVNLFQLLEVQYSIDDLKGNRHGVKATKLQF